MLNAKKSLIGLGAALAIFANTAALAEEFVIKTAVTQWRPMIIFVQPGDMVKWMGMAGHDTTSLDGMIPEGAEKWSSKMGDNYAITFEKEGVYIYKCTPHASMGMIGAIVVGKPTNLDAVKEAAKAPKDAPKGMVKRVLRKLDKKLAG